MKHFHEWPLVVFTTLAILGAGMLTVPLGIGVIDVHGGAVDAIQLWREASASRTLVGLALLLAGLVVSMAHLGKPARSPRALARLGHSRLSVEVALAGATLAAGAAAVAWPVVHSLALVTALCAAAFLPALGFVYALPGQLTWGGASAITPLTTGLGFGALVLLATPGGPASGIPLAAPVLLGVDVIAFALRWRMVSLVGQAEAWPHTSLLAARFVLVDVLPCVLLLAGLPKGAAGFLGLGILVDRLGFYLLAAQHTTEREIARIEALMEEPPGADEGDSGAR